MNLVFFDLETRSLADLSTVGGRAYAYDESTEVMCLVAWIDGVYHLWTPTDCTEVLWPAGLEPDTFLHHTGPELPAAIAQAAMDPSNIFVAHNCDEFDKHVWMAKLRPVPERWLDTVPLARCGGYPGALDKLSYKFLGVGKNKTAVNMLMKCCKLPTPPGPGALSIIASYNIADVVALRAIYEKVKDFADPVYDAHLAVNERGVLLDRELATRIWRVCNAHVERAGREIEELTGGYLKPADLTRRNYVYDWVLRQGIRLPDLRRETVQLLLDDPDKFYEEIMEGDDGE